MAHQPYRPTFCLSCRNRGTRLNRPENVIDHMMRHGIGLQSGENPLKFIERMEKEGKISEIGTGTRYIVPNIRQKTTRVKVKKGGANHPNIDLVPKRNTNEEI